MLPLRLISPYAFYCVDVDKADDVEIHNRFEPLRRLLSGDDCDDEDSMCSHAEVSSSTELYDADVGRKETESNSRAILLT